MKYPYPYISPDTRAALDRYHFQHIATGGFLEAVIRNDLLNAVGRAVGENRDLDVIQDIIWYVHNELPALALDFTRWTTCLCERYDPDHCFVHSYPEGALRRAAEVFSDS